MARWPIVGRASESLLAADHGSGRPVLLVHGQPGDAADWDGVVLEIASEVRLLVVDRPGYGGCTLAATSMAENAEVLADLLVGRGAAPAVVVGHSYGGGVALLMARRRPEVVSGLVLLGSVGAEGSVNGFDHLLALPAVGEVLSAAGLFVAGRVLPRLASLSGRLSGRLAHRLHASLPDGRYGAALSRAGLRMWQSFVTEQRALVAEIGDVEEASRHVSVPSVVLSGTWDVVVPPSSAAALAAAMPGAQLVLLTGVGHLAARDAPRAVADAVRRVVSRSAGD